MRLGRALVISLLISAVPATAWACACGCSVFGVGTRWTMPTGPGFRLSLQYSFMDQSQNWQGWSSASPALNGDKDIRTHFFTLSAEEMFNRSWGIRADLPVWDRYLKTTSDSGELVTGEHLSLSDASVMGMYTGLSDDMSTGLELGFKLPTGPDDLSVFDRDTQPGYGSTSLLLGAYQLGQGSNWGWWAQGIVRVALYGTGGYRPGNSYNLGLGAHYDGFARYRLVPSLQLVASIRGSDSGSAADPANTGFQRLFVVPGLEIPLVAGLDFFADLDFPVLTHTSGDQLVAPWLASATLSESF